MEKSGSSASDRYLTNAEAAAVLKLSPRTLEKLRMNGGGPRFRKFGSRVIYARWSGEGCWIPLGGLNPGLSFENPTSYPAPGQFIFYPGGFSETELLLAYGSVRFASKVGQLAGNHFLTIAEGTAELAAVGRKVLWEGCQDIVFESLG
ncbi:MAG TPA: DUF3830 family protein [Steroidobacteraceae bacterium]|jgi:hypothetical protein